MPRRMSVWPVAIQTLTPPGIGIIAASEAQAPAAALRRPRPGQLVRDSRQARSRLSRILRAPQKAKMEVAARTSMPEPAQSRSQQEQARARSRRLTGPRVLDGAR